MVLRGYRELIFGMEGSMGELVRPNKDRVEALCASLLAAVKHVYLGHSARAFDSVASALDSVKEFLPIQGETHVARNTSVYRARLGARPIKSRLDMFHVPFERRDLISMQRYSVNGLPCFYAGHSIYACWEELGRPDLRDFQVCRVEYGSGAMRFLDFFWSTKNLRITAAWDQQRVSDFQMLDDRMLADYLISWPVIASCSFIRAYSNGVPGAFAPEYILPQLVLQWVCTQKDLDGVRYFSNRVGPDIEREWSLSLNYAMPARTCTSSGHCEVLKRKLHLTNPISWEMMSIADPTLTSGKISDEDKAIWLDGGSGTLVHEYLPGSKVPYWGTVFGRMEIQLLKLKAERLCR